MKIVNYLSLILVIYLSPEVLSVVLQCICVSYENCNFNYTLKGYRTDYHELRTYSADRPRPSCESAVDVCCDLSSNNSETDTYFQKSTTKTPPVKEWACGYRGGQGKATNFGKDADAQPGEFPWTVAVLRKDKQNSYHCGGSLINEKAVLTSAREVYKLKPTQLVVRLGQYDWKSKDEHHQDIQVKHIYIHPNFKVESLTHNDAILILEESAKPGARVNSICLPSSHDDYELSNCIETGWGKDRAAVNQKGSVLKKSEVHVMNRKTCDGIYQRTYNNHYYKLHHSILCAADDRLQAPCTGSGGSPIICPLKHNKNRYVQVGVATIAVCNENNMPALYTDVPDAHQWINKIISSQDLNTNSYTV